jgi:hypothetical protein
MLVSVVLVMHPHHRPPLEHFHLAEHRSFLLSSSKTCANHQNTGFDIRNSTNSSSLEAPRLPARLMK